MTSRHTRLFAACSLLAFALACATASSSTQPPREPRTLSPADAQALHHLLQRFGADGELDPRMEDRVALYLSRLDGKDRPELERRRLAIWPDVKRALDAANLPEALGAITYVESHFEPGVRGGNECAGLWQFIAPTARNQGLTVDARLDERLDPEKSSRAAARYLSALVGEFGSDSFLLAIAAYNAGEVQLREALRKSKAAGGPSPTSFWTLDERGLLPDETLRYVPQVLAAAIALLPPESR